MKRIAMLWSFALLCLVLLASGAHAAEKRFASPDGAIKVIVSDSNGLNYRVEIGGKAD